MSSFQSRKATKASRDGYLKENSPSVTSESQNNDDDEEHINRGEEKQIDMNQEYRKRSVPRILRTCRFNKEKEEEKHYRELLMRYTAWRQEEVDLIGTATSYKNRYFEIKDIVEGVRCQYEPLADELDEAVHDIEGENGLQNAWEKIAPLTKNQVAIDEDLHTDESVAEPYDIGQDLGLPSQVIPDNFQAITMVPDEVYRRQMRTLDKKQCEFVISAQNGCGT